MCSSNQDCLNKSNLLVYQKPTGQREERKPDRKKSSPYAATINRIQPKIIQICTGADMKRMCPPPCDCRIVMQKKPGFMAFVGLGVKMAFAAACVYVSYDMGTWGTPNDTQELYKKFCLMGRGHKKPNEKWVSLSCLAQNDMFSPTRFRAYSHCDEPLFFTERTIHNWQNKWNQSVETVFTSLAKFPRILREWSQAKQKLLREEKIKCIDFNDLAPEERISNNYKRH